MMFQGKTPDGGLQGSEGSLQVKVILERPIRPILTLLKGSFQGVIPCYIIDSPYYTSTGRQQVVHLHEVMCHMDG